MLIMNNNHIVLDTNILFSGLYSSRGASHQVLRKAYAGEITPVISTTLLFEYEDVLKRNIEKLDLTIKKVDVILDNICALAIFQDIHFLWRPFLKDPKDDCVLEVCVASQADVIVTHNIKDFVGVDKFGIKAMRPGELLRMIK